MTSGGTQKKKLNSTGLEDVGKAISGPPGLEIRPLARPSSPMRWTRCGQLAGMEENLQGRDRLGEVHADCG
jgi:hypothetical protein